MGAALTKITESERNTDNSLKPETRERVLSELAEYISYLGYINIGDISRRLGVAYYTARSLIDEVVAQWLDEESNQIAAQLRWYERKAEEIEIDPVRFGISNEMGKIAAKNDLFDRMNRLRVLQFGINSRTKLNDAVLMKNYGTLKPRTVKLLELNGNNSSTALSANI